jgi:lysozyme family protein|tara:strand:- start:12359 stop:12910 length:552 start_codon:yes stop_codon:yes gene_type:complete
MTANNFEKCLSLLLAHEGGFVNHPEDPGGATNKGITKKTYERFLGREVEALELENISEKNVKKIYKTRYWNKIAGDKLPAGIDYIVFDLCVNGGPRRAIKTLQKVLNSIVDWDVAVDGVMGPKTHSALSHACDNDKVIDRLTREKGKFYRKLKTFNTFGRGWWRRNDEVHTAALLMATLSVKK